MGKYFRIEVEDRIAFVTYHNGNVNAMCEESYREMAVTFGEVSKDPDVRCVIFRTEGKGFIGGNDVGEIAAHNRTNHAAYQAVVGHAVCSIMKCKVPVIAAVQGYTIGVGFVMAAACDLVVASERAWFNLPELSLGIIAGTGFIKTVIPEKVVQYLCLTGDRIKAQQLMAYGGINFVVPPDELMCKAIEIAKKIAAQPPQTVKAHKEWIQKCYNNQCAEKFEMETVFTGRLLETPERRECMQAFYEKRPAQFP